MVTATLLLHVTLALPLDALPPVTLDTAVAEAAALWAPYGVIVDAAGPCSPVADDTTRLTVAVVATASRVVIGWRGPLGAIAFGADGAPASTLMIYMADILQFIRGARVLGADLTRWPVDPRQRIVGRALGRVMAHEIGHYVLQTPQHTRTGLMRPVRSPDDLVSPSRHGFELTLAERSQALEAGR
jgi:hypothetical protein